MAKKNIRVAIGLPLVLVIVAKLISTVNAEDLSQSLFDEMLITSDEDGDPKARPVSRAEHDEQLNLQDEAGQDEAGLVRIQAKSEVKRDENLSPLPKLSEPGKQPGKQSAPTVSRAERDELLGLEDEAGLVRIHATPEETPEVQSSKQISSLPELTELTEQGEQPGRVRIFSAARIANSRWVSAQQEEEQPSEEEQPETATQPDQVETSIKASTGPDPKDWFTDLAEDKPSRSQAGRKSWTDISLQVDEKTIPKTEETDSYFASFGAEYVEPNWVDRTPVGMQYSFYHNPLYFEDANLERCGHYLGWYQSAVSAAHFFGTIPLLPYKMALDCPDECVWALGDCPTCARYPYRDNYLPRWDGKAALVEGAFITGLVLVIP